MKQRTRAFLLEQCTLYPALEPVDLLKALHQSVFGNGHFITDEAASRALLHRELSGRGWAGGTEAELLDGDYFRLHLQALKESSLSEETLFRLFVLSAAEPVGSEALLKGKVAVLQELAAEGALPCSCETVSAAVDAWEQAGFPACHHSEVFREVYHPAYRVLHKRFLPLLPLLAAIDRKLAEQNRVLLAVEGGSAAGKTTLAASLKEIYGCTVFHMDDFFLRPEQRTPERLAQPGGNVDYERFYEEVLEPLSQGRPVSYRRYDCHTQTLGQPVTPPVRALTVVEGAYSMHPALAGYYDLTVFLSIDSCTQRERILRRNGQVVAERFFTRWIPLEQLYFDALRPAERCDLVLETDQ